MNKGKSVEYWLQFQAFLGRLQDGESGILATPFGAFSFKREPRSVSQGLTATAVWYDECTVKEG